MGNLNHTFNTKSVTKIEAKKLTDVSENLKLDTIFAVAVNSDDFKKIKLVTTIQVRDEDHNQNLCEVSVEGLYDSNNTKDSITLNDFENPAKMVNELMPDSSEIIGYITNKMYGVPLEIPSEVPDDFLENK